MRKTTFRRSVLALLLFSVSFGYVEAAVVVYLRGLSQPLRAKFYPASSALSLFPLLTPSQLKAGQQGELWRVLKIEVGREAATMAMLAAVALATGENLAQCAAAFVMMFGVWDIAFYGFLRLLVHWPQSPLTWDLLFLIPVPWVGPVLAPVIVSVSMIAAGFFVLRREWSGQPAPIGLLHWAGIMLGGIVIILSFTWGSHRLMAGAAPATFSWPLFAAGEAFGLGAFLHAMKGERLATKRKGRQEGL